MEPDSEFLSSEVIGAELKKYELVEAMKRVIDSSRICDDDEGVVVAGNEIVTIVEVANDHWTMDLSKLEKKESVSVLDDSKVLYDAIGVEVDNELKDELVEVVKREIDSSRICDNDDDDDEGVLVATENERVNIIDGNMELVKHEGMECGSVLDYSKVTYEKIGAKVESEQKKDGVMEVMIGADAEALVVTRNEENDETVGIIELAKHKGIECASVLNDSMLHHEAMGVELESELKKDGVREVMLGVDAEAIAVARNEENGEMVEEEFSNVEATMEVVKDGAMDEKKREEVERGSVLDDSYVVMQEQENEAMGVQWENFNVDTEKSVLNKVEENEEMMVDAYLSTGEAKVVEEMDATKHEELEFASILAAEEDEAMCVEEETANVDAEMEIETDMVESGKGKRKRSNYKTTGNSKAITKASSRKSEEEDVCFICFDGGDLVFCDRRGCPKAYHPSCVNRDEAFFQGKDRWNCGWHLCSVCEKNAYYMCYTCTFSLCKGCVKDAVILCIRGNEGFCETCMRTVKLIESNGHADKDVPVDFDDKSSWEFLFKDYFVDLKMRLSLSSEEIASAKSPWKGSDESAKIHELAEPQYDNNGGGASSSDDSIETLEASKIERRSLKRQSKSLRKEDDSTSAAAASRSEVFSTAGTTEWASKELLEFVKHMKNGDASVISQFDVQALLLEYIKTKKLRDPRRKSQIICDSRLERLFGKSRVGQFEMLKLLESHFLMKEDSQTDYVQGSVVDTEVNHFEADANADALISGVKDKKRKLKNGGSRGPQSNLDDYAAIDVHNISLIYLRRKLIEDLLEETDNFHDKVVGTFVRIRISGSGQKQDVYRLVQVVGTSKAAESYKLGKRTTDIVLEILNLNKTVVISIDKLSNQDFTEQVTLPTTMRRWLAFKYEYQIKGFISPYSEECKRLRQSIRCGLINTLTVGDILDNTMEIQAARVDDWMESEILRLNHLRDRASEKGHKKELRECVEKLQLLKTPDERRRRLEEVPEIHADPNMDPSYISEDDDDTEKENTRDVYTRSTDSSFNRRGRGPVSPQSNLPPKDSWGSAGKIQSEHWESNRSLSSKNSLSKCEDAAHAGEVNENAWSRGKDWETEPKNLEKLVSATNSETIGWNSHVPSRSSGIASMPSPATLPVIIAETAIKVNETEKMWHYKDPSGKVQGPFSIVQLRKWSNRGYFPADLTIWRTTEKEDESILLTDALAGRFEKDSPAVDNVLSRAIMKNQNGERPYVNHTRGSENSPSHSVSSRWEISSPEVSAPSTERWNNSVSFNIPSATPKQDKPGWGGRDGGSFTVPKSYPVGCRIRQSSPSALTDAGFHPSSSTSVQNSGGRSTSRMHHSQSISSNEQHTAVMNSQPGSQDGTVQSIQSLNTQKHNVDAHSFGAASVPASVHPQGYGNWVTSSVQNSAVSFSSAGASVTPQPDYWSAETQAGQSNALPPSVPWGVGQPENVTSASALRPENSNTGWDMMPGNPNVTRNGQVPEAINMNWGTIQAMPAGTANSGFVVPTVPVPGNLNQGWVAPLGDPAMHGVVPGNANQGWVAPAVNVGSTVQGPTPGNGWVIRKGNPGSHVQGQLPGDRNANQGWRPSGRQGTRKHEHHRDGRNFSDQIDRGFRSGNSGYSSGCWNRQSSFGRGPGGSSRRFSKRNVPCPYNANGQCLKGSSCDYLHS